MMRLISRYASRYLDLLIAIVVVILAVFIMISESRPAEPVMPQYVITGADSQRGQAAIVKYGCGSCHTIPGIQGANAFVGPSLEHFASRSYIAGNFPNLPENLVPWIENAQAMLPNNAMPNMNVSEGDARDIAAYLYTLH